MVWDCHVGRVWKVSEILAEKSRSRKPQAVLDGRLWSEMRRPEC